MKNEYKKLFDDISPDDKLVEDVIGLTIKEKHNTPRVIALVASLIILFCGIGTAVHFSNRPEIPVIDKTVNFSETQYASKETTKNKTTEKEIKDIYITELSTLPDGIGGDDGTFMNLKYREIYYFIGIVWFSDIVGKDAYDEWETEYYENNPYGTAEEMMMVTFIKEFDISREDFDRANIRYAELIKYNICYRPQDYRSQEFDEVFNGDIIYTFDNEIINEYYLSCDYPFDWEDEYLEAVEAGTYESRTDEFLSVEKMELDFFLKYGYPSELPEIMDPDSTYVDRLYEEWRRDYIWRKKHNH